jgi:hypothetical protein
VSARLWRVMPAFLPGPAFGCLRFALIGGQRAGGWAIVPGASRRNGPAGNVAAGSPCRRKPAKCACSGRAIPQESEVCARAEPRPWISSWPWREVMRTSPCATWGGRRRRSWHHRLFKALFHSLNPEAQAAPLKTRKLCVPRYRCRSTLEKFRKEPLERCLVP